MKVVRDRAVLHGRGKTGKVALQWLDEAREELNKRSTPGRLISRKALEDRYRKMAQKRKARPAEVTEQRKAATETLAKKHDMTVAQYRKDLRSKKGLKANPSARHKHNKDKRLERLEPPPENRFVKTESGWELSDDAVVYVKRMLSKNFSISDIALKLGKYKVTLRLITKLQSDIDPQSDMDAQSDIDPQSDMDPQ